MKDTLKKLIQISAKKIFEVMIPLDIKAVETIPDIDMDNKLIATIDFSGKMYGTMLIHAPYKLAEEIAYITLIPGEEESVEPDEVRDCLGELVNIVSGSVRNKLYTLGLATEISIPVVYSDLDKDIHIDIEDAQKVTQYFLIKGQPLMIEMLYTRKKKKEGTGDLTHVDKKKIKAEFINPILAGFANGFKQITQFDLQMDKPTIKYPPIVSDSICIHLGITGDLAGKILYDFNETNVFKIIEFMIKTPLTHFDDLARSGINEICNILTANCCSALSAAGYTCDITPPIMLEAKGMNISIFDHDVHILYIPMIFPHGSFGVYLAIKELA